MAKKEWLQFRTDNGLAALVDEQVEALSEEDPSANRSSVCRMLMEKALGTPEDRIVAKEVLRKLSSQVRASAHIAIDKVAKQIRIEIEQREAD